MVFCAESWDFIDLTIKNSHLKTVIILEKYQFKKMWSHNKFWHKFFKLMTMELSIATVTGRSTPKILYNKHCSLTSLQYAPKHLGYPDRCFHNNLYANHRGNNCDFVLYMLWSEWKNTRKLLFSQFPIFLQENKIQKEMVMPNKTYEWLHFRNQIFYRTNIRPK